MQRILTPIVTTARGFFPDLIEESDLAVADGAAGDELFRNWRSLSRSESQEWVPDLNPAGAAGQRDILLPTINGIARPGISRTGSLEWLYIPNHLLNTVWELLSEGPANNELHHSFSEQLIDFLSFKNVSTPRPAQVDIVVSSVGICSEPTLLRSVSGQSGQLCVIAGRAGGVEPIICFNGGPTEIFLFARFPSGEAWRQGDSTSAVPGDAALSRLPASGRVIRIRMEPGEGAMVLNGFADWCLASGDPSSGIAAVVVATETSTAGLTA